MPCISVVVDPPADGPWEPPLDGSDPAASPIAVFPVLRLVIAVPSTNGGWGGQRVEDVAETATKRIEAAYGVRIEVGTFVDSAGGLLEPADKLSDLQLHPGSVLRAVRLGSPMTRLSLCCTPLYI